MANKDYIEASTPPARQGFYEAELEDGTELVAEWREHTKGAGKSWFRWHSDDPTLDKQPLPLTGVARYRPASKEAVATALRREPTVEEKIAAVLDRFRRDEGLYDHRNRDVPPPNRQLIEGDEVIIGMLPEAKVVRVLDDGRCIIISYRSIDHNYGRPIDNGIVYGAWHWTSVVARRWVANHNRVTESVLFDSFRTSTVESLFSKVRHGINAHPDYQRGYTWTEEDQQRYLDSLFVCRDLGRFVFVNQSYPKPDDILDGKQRLNCLWQFFTSRLAHRGVYWHELSVRDQDRIENRTVQYAEFDASRVTKSALLRIFLELNAAGVPQTAEHLAYVEALLAKEQAAEDSR